MKEVEISLLLGLHSFEDLKGWMLKHCHQKQEIPKRVQQAMPANLQGHQAARQKKATWASYWWPPCIRCEESPKGCAETKGERKTHTHERHTLAEVIGSTRQ